MLVVFMLYAVLTFGATAAAFAGDVLIIANTGVSEKNLSPDKIKGIFLGDIPKWGNNEMITLVVCDVEDMHRDFLQKYLKRTESQFRNVWRQNLFTGKGKQPIRTNSVDELIKSVSQISGAIGYIPSGKTLPSEVKVISQ